MKTQITPLAKPAHFIEFLEFLREGTFEKLDKAEIRHKQDTLLHNANWASRILFGKYLSWEDSLSREILNNDLKVYHNYKCMALYYQAMDTSDFQAMPVPDDLQAGFYMYCRENNLPNTCEDC